MVGRTWRDLQRGQKSGPVASAAPAQPARREPKAVLAELPKLDSLLQQRQDLERRMQTLTAGTDGLRDARDAVRFPVQGLPERRAEYRRWESAHDRDRRLAQENAQAARAGDAAPPETPQARLARWFRERDARNASALDNARDRSGDQGALAERLDGRTAGARQQALSDRLAENAAERAQQRAAERTQPDQPAMREVGDRPARPTDPLADLPLRDRFSDENRTLPEARLERAEPPERRGPDLADLLDARPRRPRAPQNDLDNRPRRRTGSEDQSLDRRLERARQRLIGRDSDIQRVTRKLDDAGRQVGSLSDKLDEVDRKLAAEGLEEERKELKNSPLGKVDKTLKKGSDILRRPQRAVDRANAEWEKRRDQISGILPVDRSFRDRAAALLGVDTGTIEQLEERMNRVKERALRKRSLESEQERRDEQRRERARERAAERKREEARGR